MRTLVVSVGNTSIRGGLFTGARLVRRFRFHHDPLASAARFSTALARVLPRNVDRAALCSVVPARTQVAARCIRKYSGVPSRVLRAASRHGLAIRYRKPSTFGTDRLACAIGARKRFPGRNVIVVDCGTATTVTAIDRRGRVLGGAILPGPALWAEAVARGTARLPRIQPVRAWKSLGRSPREALMAGIFHGHAGAVRELVRLVQSEAFGRSAAVVVGTGGGAPSLSREKLFTVLAPDLILNGLFVFASQDADHA